METNWERSPVPQMRLGRHVLCRESDFRYDGQRVRSRRNGWGDWGTRSFPKNDPIRNSRIVDLEWRANYSGQQGKPGSIKYYREPLDSEVAKRSAGQGWTSAAGFGYFPSNEPIDAYIRRSDKAVVRPTTETVNGSACYVIEAQSQEGQLTVWIDPAHGYHVAKATIVRKEGHKVHGNTFSRGHKEETTLTNLSFKQVNGVWVPVEFVYETDIMRPPVFIMNGKTHAEITEFLIDPDHEALKSFEVNDFPEGTRTSYTDHGRLLPVWFIWKDGRPVPDLDPSVNRELDKIADSLLPGADPNGAAPELLKDTTHAPVARVLDAFAATQSKLQSFVSREEVSTAGQTGVETCDFRCDGDRVRHQWSLSEGPDGSTEGKYASFLWDGTHLIEYTRDGGAAGQESVVMSPAPERKAELIAVRYKGAPLMGFLAGNTRRVDEVLRSARRSSVRPTEIWGHGACELVEAETDEGSYKVWFDPERDYQMVKAEIRRRPGDPGEARQAMTAYLAACVYNVRLEQVDGVWVPLEADVVSCAGVGAPVVRYHLKRQEFRLNPDHEGLGSFAANDIPDGTAVSMTDAAGKTKEGVWKGGQAIWKDK